MAAFWYGCIQSPCLKAATSLEQRTTWLRLGENYWVPEVLEHRRLSCKVDCKDTWGRIDCSCVLLDDDAAVLAVLGPHGLSETDGVSLRPSGDSSGASFWLGRLNRNVRQLLFVAAAATSHRPLTASGLPQNTAGPCTVTFSYTAGGDAAAHFGAGLQQRDFCSMRVQLPSCLPGTLVVLASFLAGSRTAEPFRLCGLGKAFALGAQSSPCISAASLGPVLAELASEAQDFSPRGKVQGIVPMDFASADEIVIDKVPSMLGFQAKDEEYQDLTEPLAAANRLSESRYREVTEARERAADVNEELNTATQDLQKVEEAMWELQRELEAWQKEAAQVAQAPGGAQRVVALLSKLPASVKMRQLLSTPARGGHPEDSTPRPRIGYRLDSCPPASIVGDAALSQDLREEEVADYVKRQGELDAFSTGCDTARGPPGADVFGGEGAPAGPPSAVLPEPAEAEPQAPAQAEPQMPAEATEEGNELAEPEIPSDPAEVRKLLERWQGTLHAKEKAKGPEHLDVAKTLVGLAAIHGALGQPEQQKECLERALPICEREYGPDHVGLAALLTDLGAVEATLGRPSAQKQYLLRALSIKEEACGEQDPLVATTLVNLASAHAKLGELDSERDCLQLALLIKEKEYGPESPKIAVTLAKLGNLQRRLGDLEQSAQLLERSAKIKEQDKGPNNPELGSTLMNLGFTHGKLGNKVRQREVIERAAKIFELSCGPEHNNTARARKALKDLDKAAAK